MLRNASLLPRVFVALSALFAAFALTACDGGSGGGSGSASVDTGSASIFITDSPTDRFDEILITIEAIDLIGDGGHVRIFEGEETIDLKDLEDFSDLFVHAYRVPVGTYSKIRLRVTRIRLVDGDEVIDVDPPANGKLDLNPRGDFRIRRGVNLMIEIDMDAEKSIHIVQTGNRDRYRFRPVVFVTILESFSPSKLTRVHGEVVALGDADDPDQEGDFRLCSTVFLASRDGASREDGGIGTRHRCLDVETDDDTGVFDENGDPVDVSDVRVRDEVTVVGRIHLVDDNHDRMMGAGAGAGATSGTHGDHLDLFTAGTEGVAAASSAPNDDRYERPDEERDRPDLVLIAYVIEIGPVGTFLHLAGIVETSPGGGDEFDFAVAPGQGFGDSSVLAALLQDGTRIFSRRGHELDDFALQPETRAKIDGVLESDASGTVYKTALIVVKAAPDVDVLRGTIVFQDVSTRRLIIGFDDGSDPPEQCVDVPVDADIFLVREVDDGSTSERAEFEDLFRGLQTNVFGELVSGAECFTAGTVIGFPAACDATAECGAGGFCDKEPRACDSRGECRASPALCPLALMPVCGCDGNTHDNACSANAAGTTVAHEGSCSVGPGPCGGDAGVLCQEGQFCLKPSGACDDTAEGVCAPLADVCPPGEPVCACDGNTYASACEAARAGVDIEHKDECAPGGECGGPLAVVCPEPLICLVSDRSCNPAATGHCVDRPQVCPDVYAPVCSCDQVTYANACQATRAGAAIAFDGECMSQPVCGGPAAVVCLEGEICVRRVGQCSPTDPGFCGGLPRACPTDVDPVCGCDGEDYSNPCLAFANGGGIAHLGRCDTGPPICAGIGGFVCPDGLLCVIEDGCIADGLGVCVTPPLSCADLDEPVCGCDGNTYRSRCTANVARVPVASEGVCPPFEDPFAPL